MFTWRFAIATWHLAQSQIAQHILSLLIDSCCGLPLPPDCCLPGHKISTSSATVRCAFRCCPLSLARKQSQPRPAVDIRRPTLSAFSLNGAQCHRREVTILTVQDSEQGDLAHSQVTAFIVRVAIVLPSHRPLAASTLLPVASSSLPALEEEVYAPPFLPSETRYLRLHFKLENLQAQSQNGTDTPTPP